MNIVFLLVTMGFLYLLDANYEEKYEIRKKLK